jgi:hypothetical protein
MKIAYGENPLAAVVELDAHDVEELRLKIMIDELEGRIYGANACLTPGDDFSAEDAVETLNVAGLDDAKFGAWIDSRLGYCLKALRGPHNGDCVCEPNSCLKCQTEAMLCIDTIAGLGKFAAWQIAKAFKEAKSRGDAMELLGLSLYRVDGIVRDEIERAMKWLWRAPGGSLDD